MKKLYGLPTLVVSLAVLATTVIIRILNSPQPDHALHWRIPIDLMVYVLAGREVAQGQDLYDHPLIRDLPFTYPPVSGWFFSLLSRLSDNWIIIVWQGGTALALLIVIALVLRERGMRMSPLTWVVAVLITVASLGYEPFHGTLFFGQINVFLMLMVAMDFLPRKFRLPGVGVGLAAGIKLTPAFFGLVFLIQRRWWAALGAVLTFLVTMVVGFLTIPDAMHFWTDAMFQSSRVGSHDNPGAQSLRSVMERCFGIAGGWPWLIAVLIVVVLTILAVRVAKRRGNATAAMSLTGLSACLVSPFSWFHHWVWILPMGLAVLIWVNQELGRRWQRRGWQGWLGGQAAALCSVAAAFVVLLPYIGLRTIGPLSYRGLDVMTSFQPWMHTVFIGSAIVYIAAYAASGLLPAHRTRDDAASVHPA